MPEKRTISSDSNESTSKKISIKQTAEEESNAINYFQKHVFESDFKSNLKSQVENSKPYRWGTIKNLIDDELLRNVRKEIMSEIEFTKKETDIYKVFQSGDLANLSAMPEDLLKRIPSMYKLRSAIYSETFRDFVSDVTGCGKLSGLKTDLSIQLYQKGCHLLTHDDVIGSRRVSFILYMPDPDFNWKPHYGGSLQLFDSLVPNVPKSDVYDKLTPNFNQIAFFEVQPGLSFHAVEEVKVERSRLSLQGWFHIPQKGEDGYEEGINLIEDIQRKKGQKSTLEQLESNELKEFDFPRLKFSKCSSIEDNVSSEFPLELDTEEIEYLAKFLNPQLLNRASIEKLSKIFDDESVVDIMSFLNKDYEGVMKHTMRSFEINEYPNMPNSEKEIEELYPWKLAIPSHKQRFMYIDGLEYQDIKSSESISKVNEINNKPNFEMTKEIFQLQDKLDGLDTTYQDFKEGENPKAAKINDVSVKLCEIAIMFRSKAFKKWLTLITSLRIMRENVLVRRFRPGNDFILATKDLGELDNNDNDNTLLDGILEATLNLTPSGGWETGEWGGYELCLLDDDVDNKAKGKKEVTDNRDTNIKDEDLNEDEAAIYRTADTDSVVYESQACWNKLSLMFRDQSVLKFVKYVSFDAPGSRWDIKCAWKCEEENEVSDDEDCDV